MKNRVHIVIVVPRGEVIRNFLYSKTLDVLTKRARVSVLSVVHDQRFTEYFSDMCEQVFPLEKIKEHRVVRLLRQLLEYSHERYMWSQPAQTRWRKREARYISRAAKSKWMVKKTIANMFGNQLGLQILSQLEHAASRALEPTDRYIKLWQELQPDVVFNGSHIHSPAAVLPVQAASRLGIKTATFVFSWDNLTSRGRIFLPYDHYLMWNTKMQKQLLELYPRLRPEQVTVTGTPQFDYHFDPDYFWTREEFCRRVGADPDRPIVAYTTGMVHYMPEEPRIVAGIADMLQEMGDGGSPQLLVRVYPKDTSGRFEKLKRERPNILFPEVPWEQKWMTPHHTDLPLLTNTLRHAAVGINVASTVSLELAMLDKPVINVGYNPPSVDISPVNYAEYYDFDHYRPVVESGAVKVARSEEDMRCMILRSLEEPQADSAARRRFIQQMFDDTLDGCSGERVAVGLLNLA